MAERNKMNECHTCKNKGNIPGDCHISCKKPDPKMKGNPHGISHGWFFYPFNFDPCWKTRDCENYESSVHTS